MLELVGTTPSYKKHLTSWIYEKILIKPFPLIIIVIISIFVIEALLREHHEELGELVKERTTELLKANEKLKLEVTERKKTGEELQKRVVQLKDFYDMSIGRELRMQELRNKIERLELEINRLESELSKYKE
jgi:C4-dicarboxylate-specific signal transduction histidine kinase